MTRLGSILAVLACALVCDPGPVIAHDVDVAGVARIFLDEVSEHGYRLSVVDRLVPPIGDAGRALPARCAALPREDDLIAGLSFACDGGLQADDDIVLPWRLSGVVVIATWHDGRSASAYFRGEGGRVVVRLGDLRASGGPRGRQAARYFRLGIEHIVFGIDHLLFVAGLLLLVRGAATLVKTITAFTVAHSITLGAAALGYAHLPRAPVEAAIALSLVLLAREIVVGARGHVHLIHRWPWIVAFTFGLLHGFGFAGALGEIGLRPDDVPVALLFFNLGIEAGQLAFVAGLVTIGALATAARPLRVIAASAPRWAWTPGVQVVLGYAIGVLAVRWLFDRLPGIWS